MIIHFSTGDVVSIKSGSRLMTVEKVEAETVYCCWFSDEGVLHKQEYPSGILDRWERKTY